jgi:proline iminopeptidase
VRLLTKYEQLRDFSNPAYTDIVYNQIYAKHVCRIVPNPDPVVRGMTKHLNTEVYGTMQGPNEFTFEGVLDGWTAWERLPQLAMPVLTIGGKYDTMNPAEMEEMSNRVQRGRYLYCPNGSHLSMYDDQQTYMKGVIAFLNDVQRGTFKK